MVNKYLTPLHILLDLGSTTVLWLIPNIQPATALSIGGSQRWRQAVKAGGARTGFGQSCAGQGGDLIGTLGAVSKISQFSDIVNRGNVMA